MDTMRAALLCVLMLAPGFRVGADGRDHRYRRGIMFLFMLTRSDLSTIRVRPIGSMTCHSAHQIM